MKLVLYTNNDTIFTGAYHYILGAFFSNPVGGNTAYAYANPFSHEIGLNTEQFKYNLCINTLRLPQTFLHEFLHYIIGSSSVDAHHIIHKIRDKTKTWLF